MKLFVDDIRNAPDDTWSVTRTITSAISAIEAFDFDVISLDHDISHQVIMGLSSRPYPCEEVFVPVAFFIKEKYQNRILAKKAGAKITCLSIDCPERKGGECKQSRLPKIIIHTSNPAGALRMMSILEDFDVKRNEYVPSNRLETVVKN